MKMIDADNLKLVIRDDDEIDGRNFARMKMHIDDAPVVDAKPVVHGRWVHDKPWLFGFECNRCGKWILPEGTNGDMNYCPNCGALMDGDVNG